MPGSGFSIVGVVTKQMESGLQGAYTRQTRARKRHRVVTEERNRQAGPGAGNVRRKKDASRGDSTCLQIRIAGMISHRHTGCWEGSGSEDSQCKGPGVEMAFASPRNRKDHKVEMQGCDGGGWGATTGRAGRSGCQQEDFVPSTAGSHEWEGAPQEAGAARRRWLWLFSKRKLPEGPAGSLRNCAKVFLICLEQSEQGRKQLPMRPSGKQ